VKSLPNRERLTLIDETLIQLGVRLTGEPSELNAAMSWDQVRQLQRRGFEFGGHTHTHPILSRIESAEELRWEITVCKKRIEAETCTPVIHFCYPNGNTEDITAQTVEEVASAGYASGVTAVAEINERVGSPFLLRRYAIYNQMPLPHFAQVLAGMHDEPQDWGGLLPQSTAAAD
jgi:peptidoglycan/xylan/chitin deacetylase (PgdA/CDA1 family)